MSTNSNEQVSTTEHEAVFQPAAEELTRAPEPAWAQEVRFLGNAGLASSSSDRTQVAEAAFAVNQRDTSDRFVSNWSNI